MAFSIRPAVLADLPAIFEIEQACFTDPWSESQLAAWIGTGYACLVCKEVLDIIGYVNLRCVLDQGDIGNVAVHPKYWRRGAGAALLRAVDALAEERGLACVQLEVRAGNAAALALYDRHGYAVVGRRQDYYRSPREDAVLMTKFFDRRV